MKAFIFFALAGIFLLPILKPAHVQAQDQYPNYVVIGAFASQTNAERFTDQANQKNRHAQYDINPNRNLYYVYVMNTSDHDAAIQEALRLRKVTEYFDAWVYHGHIGSGKIIEQQGRGDVNPDTQQVMTQVVPSGEKQNVVDVPVVDAPKQEEVLTRPVIEADEKSASFILKLYRAVDNKAVEGDVEAIDAEKSRKMATFKANEPVKINFPSGKTKTISFVSEVFGYRKQQKDFDPNNPAEEFKQDADGNIIVPFDLVRLQKGDIAVMYNVFFYKDAAIIRPESRYEVNNLLSMLQENSACKIKIHGHANGKSHGKILTMGDGDDFFSLTGAKDGFGSSTKLSEERAKVVRDYLVSKGIDASRMEVKAWGGKRPLHDKHSARAHENVRVEIEILAD